MKCRPHLHVDVEELHLLGGVRTFGDGWELFKKFSKRCDEVRASDAGKLHRFRAELMKFMKPGAGLEAGDALLLSSWRCLLFKVRSLSQDRCDSPLKMKKLCSSKSVNDWWFYLYAFWRRNENIFLFRSFSCSIYITKAYILQIKSTAVL